MFYLKAAESLGYLLLLHEVPEIRIVLWLLLVSSKWVPLLSMSGTALSHCVSRFTLNQDFCQNSELGLHFTGGKWFYVLQPCGGYYGNIISRLTVIHSVLIISNNGLGLRRHKHRLDWPWLFAVNSSYLTAHCTAQACLTLVTTETSPATNSFKFTKKWFKNFTRWTVHYHVWCNYKIKMKQISVGGPLSSFLHWHNGHKHGHKKRWFHDATVSFYAW